MGLMATHTAGLALTPREGPEKQGAPPEHTGLETVTVDDTIMLSIKMPSSDALPWWQGWGQVSCHSFGIDNRQCSDALGTIWQNQLRATKMLPFLELNAPDRAAAVAARLQAAPEEASATGVWGPPRDRPTPGPRSLGPRLYLGKGSLRVL